jgi:type 1 glutamine amidotransferase
MIMLRHLGWPVLLGALVVAGAAVLPASAGDQKKIRVVLIDGHNNHDWPRTTPVLKKALEDSGRFTVDIATHPKPNKQVPEGWKSVMFPPDFSKYDVVVSNYNGVAWPAEMQKSLDDLLKSNKIGLVIVHAANNSFGGWKEYTQMVGMGWYNKNSGDRLLLDDQGKKVIVPKGEGDGPGHRYTGPFTVTVRDGSHPITKGMPAEWLHDRDELYDNMRGPIQNVHLLATAYSKGTKAHEPMIWTVKYGDGRVFHTPMGHDVTAMRCIGFITTLQRGTEWASTGQVSLPIPSNFPTAAKTSALPAEKK